MTISESQLEIWSNQGATKAAETTHNSIRTALNSPTSLVRSAGYFDFEIYLQGSYRNVTNIRADSDVDVVVQLNQSNIPATLFLQSDYLRWAHFRGKILDTLRSYYGTGVVSEGNKSLKLEAGSGRLKADVVPCVKYYKSSSTYQYMTPVNSVEGMCFYTLREQGFVINYPKLHYENGARKNQDYTNQRYKSTVRMFKNARMHLINGGIINRATAPSYFLECLLYNVPGQLFVSNRQATFTGILTWLRQRVSEQSLSSFKCQNEQLMLFGDKPEQWSTINATNLINRLAAL